jgi:hypothetical protein
MRRLWPNAEGGVVAPKERKKKFRNRVESTEGLKMQ